MNIHKNARLTPQGRRRRRCSSPSRAVALDGFVPRLQLKDRITRCEIIECCHRRSLRDWEEALHLGRVAVEISFEHRRAPVGRKLTYGIAAVAQRAYEDDFTRR